MCLKIFENDTNKEDWSLIDRLELITIFKDNVRQRSLLEYCTSTS